MKRISKVVSVLLTVSMILTAACVSGFAAEPTCVPDKYAFFKHGTGYVAIGDSFTRGYGAGENFNKWYTEIYTSELKEGQAYGNELTDAEHARNVENSFPAEVVKLMGFYAPDDITSADATYWPIAHDNVSITYMLNLLGVDEKYKAWEQGCHNPSMIPRYNADLLLFGDKKNEDGSGYESYQFNYDEKYVADYNGPYQNYTYIGTDKKVIGVHDLIADARLITIQLGQSEVTYPSLFEAIDLVKGLKSGELTMDALPTEIGKLVKNLYDRFDYFKEVLPVLVKYIKSLNPKAKIVILGTMNPLQNVMLSDDVLLPIGSAINVVTDSMNKIYEKCANKTGCIYLDINNVDTPSTLKKVSINSLMSELEKGGSYEEIVKKLYIHGHPTAEGYKQTGRMVVNAIDEELARDTSLVKPVSPDPNIKVDIGTNYEKVHYVKLDGKTVSPKYYKTKNHLLSITCNRTNAKKLKIAIGRLESNEKGKRELKITTMSYTLKWSAKSGYSVRRVYVTNDVVETAKTTMATVKNAISAVTDKIGSAIKSLLDSIFKK